MIAVLLFGGISNSISNVEICFACALCDPGNVKTENTVQKSRQDPGLSFTVLNSRVESWTFSFSGSATYCRMTITDNDTCT